ncbi:small serum protein 2-like isoform X2 [Pantherophis guttatus]|uniref:Small serum protein 2-like isoform X2 n=1 Tax=Pantherophis guttatus TaxID=94885 RepID=A0ABM3YT32_PANGU|nr:small serum protein 2-like isoform X2 [Pantherophis guttatus]
MKVFFSLIVFSLVLVTCQACYMVPFKLQAPPGQYLPPNVCLDDDDRKMHLIGSRWIAEDCYRCHCGRNGMFCCHGEVKKIPGCKAVQNDVTCQYEYYKLDDPTQRCDV